MWPGALFTFCFWINLIGVVTTIEPFLNGTLHGTGFFFALLSAVWVWYFKDYALGWKHKG